MTSEKRGRACGLWLITMEGRLQGPHGLCAEGSPLCQCIIYLPTANLLCAEDRSGFTDENTKTRRMGRVGTSPGLNSWSQSQNSELFWKARGRGVGVGVHPLGASQAARTTSRMEAPALDLSLKPPASKMGRGSSASVPLCPQRRQGSRAGYIEFGHLSPVD